MTAIDIERLIPHRKPMRLIDSIVEISPSEIIAEKRIDPDAFFLQGHYPDHPIVPGVITCECIFQAGAALLAHRLGEVSATTGSRIPVIARIANAKFRTPICPGDQVFFVVRIQDEVSGAYFLKGEARVDDKVVASVEFTCAMSSRQTP